MATRTSSEAERQIVSDYLAGMTLESACAKHGVTAKVGVRVLRAFSVPARKGRPGKRLKDKACEVCGSVFTPDRSRRKVCSNKCAGYASKAASPQGRHCMSRTPEYNTWLKMKERTGNKRCWNYNNYGGRGIAMSDEWRNSFEAFYRDMGPRPSPKHSIERMDSDGNYCKENCSWATVREQSRNRRNNRKYLYGGRFVTIAELSEVSGVRYARLYYRLVTLKWNVDRAISQ
jgi:hypothetical protein